MSSKEDTMLVVILCTIVLSFITLAMIESVNPEALEGFWYMWSTKVSIFSPSGDFLGLGLVKTFPDLPTDYIITEIGGEKKLAKLVDHGKATMHVLYGDDMMFGDLRFGDIVIGDLDDVPAKNCFEDLWDYEYLYVHEMVGYACNSSTLSTITSSRSSRSRESLAIGVCGRYDNQTWEYLRYCRK